MLVGDVVNTAGKLEQSSRLEQLNHKELGLWEYPPHRQIRRRRTLHLDTKTGKRFLDLFEHTKKYCYGETLE